MSTPPATAPRPRRWRRRLFLTLGLLGLLLLVAPLALSLGPVRSWVAGKLGERLGRRVEIGSAFAFWGRGVELEDITVHSPEGFDGPLATVKRVHADLDVWGAVRGQIAASVRVVEPRITFRRLSGGEGNGDGILERLRSQEPKPVEEPGPAPDLKFVLIGGVVEAPQGERTPAGTLDQIQLVAALGPSGLKAEFSCIARGAKRGGGDADVRLELDQPQGAPGHFKLAVDPLDLRRGASLVLAATGVSDLAGDLELSAQGTLGADGLPSGDVRAALAGITGRTRDGTLLALDTLVVKADARSEDGDVLGKVHVAGSALRVVPAEPPGARGFTEQDLVMRGNFAWSTQQDTRSLALSEAHFNLGQAARIALSDELKIVLGPTRSALGTVELHADLARLSALSEFFPQLQTIQGGTLRVDLQARPTEQDRLHVGAFAKVEQLRLAPGEFALHGHQEREVQVSAVIKESAAEGLRIALHRLSGAGIEADKALWNQPLVVSQKGEDVRLVGPVKLSADLAQLSPLLAGALELRPGERLTGTIALDGLATLEGSRQILATTLQARGVGVPPSMVERALPPQSLDGQLRVERDPSEVRARVDSLTGMGLTGTVATARLEQAGDGWRLADAVASSSIDLSTARPWLGPMLDLEPELRLGGQLEFSKLQVVQERGRADRRIVVGAQLRDLFYQAQPGSRPLQEAFVTLTADGTMAEASGRHRMSTLKLASQGLSISAEGASVVLSPDLDLDLNASVTGQADRLAPLLATLLGSGYEDLKGQGAIEGRLVLRGSPAENLRHLIVDSNLKFGTWTSAGMELKDVHLSALRPRIDDALDIALNSGVNGGQAQAQLKLKPSKEALPWTSRVRLDRVDASRLIVSGGASNYLTYLLPALLPADSKIPVLSGLLDADVSLEAADISGPQMSSSLTGQGRIEMKEGEVRNSTLLAGGQMSQVVTVLRATVPEAADVIDGIGKALVFQSLESKFRIGQQRVHIEPLNLRGRYLNLAMRGLVHFDERLDMTADLVLEGSAGEKVKKLLPDRTIPLEMSGTLSEPRTLPRLDLKALLANPLLERLPGLDEIGKKKPKELLEDLFGRKK